MVAFGIANTKVLGVTSQLCSHGTGRDGKRYTCGQFGTSFELLSGATEGASK